MYNVYDISKNIYFSPKNSSLYLYDEWIYINNWRNHVYLNIEQLNGTQWINLT